jgi:protein SCO1/2
MTPRLLILAILVLGAILGGLLLWTPPPRITPEEAPDHQTLDLAAPPIGGDFVLEGAGGPVALANLRGRVVLLYFGYTWCPDICPTNLVQIAGALRGLTAAERARVQVIFVSVDPERDSPQRLAEYSGYFHPDILGVTGRAEQIAETARRYGAAYRRVEMPDSAMGYAVDHSAYSYLIDQEGRLVGHLDHATPAAEIIGAIRDLLGDGPASRTEEAPTPSQQPTNHQPLENPS